MERNTVTLLIRFDMPKGMKFDPDDRKDIEAALTGIGAENVEVLGTAAIKEGDQLLEAPVAETAGTEELVE